MPSKLTAAGVQHVIFDLKAHGLAEMPLLGVHNQPWAKQGLGAHRHSGAMEIVYLVRGELAFRVAGRDHVMKGNDLFWTHPGERHGSGRDPYGKSLIYWLQVRLPERPKTFLALDAGRAWPLVEALGKLPLRLFPGERRLKALFEEAFQLAGRPPSELGALGLAARLVEFLRTVAECARRRAAPESSEDIRRALCLLEERGDEAASIADLARAAYLSESRFKAKFREQLGMPPGEYVLRRRVERARKLLADEKLTVTEVAHRLGFSSSQYFATVFRRFTHERPSAIRAARPNAEDAEARKGRRGRAPGER